MTGACYLRQPRQGGMVFISLWNRNLCHPCPHSTSITSYADLVGKKIPSRVDLRRTGADGCIPRRRDRRFDDDPEVGAALASGQVDAYGVGNVRDRS